MTLQPQTPHQHQQYQRWQPPQPTSPFATRAPSPHLQLMHHRQVAVGEEGRQEHHVELLLPQEPLDLGRPQSPEAHVEGLAHDDQGREQDISGEGVGEVALEVGVPENHLPEVGGGRARGVGRHQRHLWGGRGGGGGEGGVGMGGWGWVRLVTVFVLAFAFVRVSACVRACVCMCLFIRIFMLLLICLYLTAFGNAYLYMYMCVHVCKCLSVYVHVCVRMYMRLYLCMYVFMLVYIYVPNPVYRSFIHKLQKL